MDKSYELVILEDEAVQAKHTVKSIRALDLGCTFNIDIVDTEEAFVERLEAGPVDILIADIELADAERTGIDLVEDYVNCGSPTQVIYLTGHAEWCSAAYRTEHVYYLLKPIDDKMLTQALSCAVANLVQIAKTHPLVITSRNVTAALPPMTIEYIESVRRKIVVHCGEDSYESYGALDDCEHKLPNYFLRCHKSFLINLQYVREYRGDEFLLSCGRTVPISQKRHKAARSAFMNFLRR